VTISARPFGNVHYDPYDVDLNSDPYPRCSVVSAKNSRCTTTRSTTSTRIQFGAALARLEGRIALEEILKRFPEWDVDRANASLSPTSTVRGWDSMPAVLP